MLCYGIVGGGVYVCLCVYIPARVCVHVCAFMGICGVSILCICMVCVWEGGCGYVCVYMYVSVCVCVCVCVCDEVFALLHEHYKSTSHAVKCALIGVYLPPVACSILALYITAQLSMFSCT